eukprot:1767595-Amphidinium_carterae.1
MWHQRNLLNRPDNRSDLDWAVIATQSFHLSPSHWTVPAKVGSRVQAKLNAASRHPYQHRSKVIALPSRGP